MDRGAASRVLRGAFLFFFALQAVVAILVATLIALLAGVHPRPSPWVGAMVVGASLVQLLAGLAVTTTGVRTAALAAQRLESERAEAPRSERESAAAGAGDAADAADAARLEARRDFAARLRAARGSALWATVMAAVLLSTPSWFAAFAWLSGHRGTVLLAALALLGLGYAFGFLQLGSLARGIQVRLPAWYAEES